MSVLEASVAAARVARAGRAESGDEATATSSDGDKVADISTGAKRTRRKPGAASASADADEAPKQERRRKTA